MFAPVPAPSSTTVAGEVGEQRGLAVTEHVVDVAVDEPEEAGVESAPDGVGRAHAPEYRRGDSTETAP